MFFILVLKAGAMKEKIKVYQTGTIRSLLNSVYKGDSNLHKLRRHGDFGLGTFNMFDGEMILYENNFYHADASGKIRIVSDDTVVPFAVITNFKQNHSYKSSNCQLQDLKIQIQNKLLSKNLIYAIKVVAEFDYVTFRSCSKETNPNHKIADDLPKLQHVHNTKNTKGILVGFFSPEYLDKVNVAGFHFHFLDIDCLLGGHVLDCQIINAEIFIQQCETLEIDLIDNELFYKADLKALTDVDSVENHIKNKE